MLPRCHALRYSTPGSRSIQPPSRRENREVTEPLALCFLLAEGPPSLCVSVDNKRDQNVDGLLSFFLEKAPNRMSVDIFEGFKARLAKTGNA